MKFTANKEQIINELQSLASVADKKQTLPVLANILIKCDQNEVSVLSTDLQIELEIKLPDTKIEREGEITIPAKKIADIVRELPDGEVGFEHEEESTKLTVFSSAGKYSFSTISANDFPEFDSVKSEDIHSISSNLLLKLLKKTSFAMASNNWRHYLNGCYIEKSLNTLSVTATDSQKIAQYKCEFSGETDFSGIIPRKSAVELMKILPNEDIEVQFYINDNNIAFMSKNFTFKSKLIDGNYPDLTPHLSGESGPSIKTDRKNLVDTLTRTSVFANTQFNAVKLTTLDGKLEVSAYNPGQESAEEKLDFEGNLTAPFDLAFNASLLKELLLTTDDENVTISKCGQGVLLLTSDPNQTTFLLPLLI